MSLLTDLTERTGRFHSIDNKPFGSLRCIGTSNDGESYYIIYREEPGFQSFYAFNDEIATGWTWHGVAMVAKVPFCEWQIKNKTMLINEFHTFKYANRGVGSVLMRELLIYAKEIECSFVAGILSDIDVKGDANRRSRRRHFYEKFGFEVIEDEYGKGRISLEL